MEHVEPHPLLQVRVPTDLHVASLPVLLIELPLLILQGLETQSLGLRHRIRSTDVDHILLVIFRRHVRDKLRQDDGLPALALHLKLHELLLCVDWVIFGLHRSIFRLEVVIHGAHEEEAGQLRPLLQRHERPVLLPVDGLQSLPREVGTNSWVICGSHVAHLTIQSRGYFHASVKVEGRHGVSKGREVLVILAAHTADADLNLMALWRPPDHTAGHHPVTE